MLSRISTVYNSQCPDTNPNYSNFNKTEKYHTQEKKSNGDKTRDDQDVEMSRTDFKATTVIIFMDMEIY